MYVYMKTYHYFQPSNNRSGAFFMLRVFAVFINLFVCFLCGLRTCSSDCQILLLLKIREKSKL